MDITIEIDSNRIVKTPWRVQPGDQITWVNRSGDSKIVRFPNGLFLTAPGSDRNLGHNDTVGPFTINENAPLASYRYTVCGAATEEQYIYLRRIKDLNVQFHDHANQSLEVKALPGEEIMFFNWSKCKRILESPKLNNGGWLGWPFEGGLPDRLKDIELPASQGNHPGICGPFKMHKDAPRRKYVSELNPKACSGDLITSGNPVIIVNSGGTY